MINACCSIVFFFLATICFGFETLDDYSPISEAADFEKKSDSFTTGDSALVDGQITSFPPDQTTYDRTLVSMLRPGFNVSIANKLAIRTILETRYYIRKQHEEEEPRRIIEEDWFDGRPSIDLTVFGTAGLEIFGGAQGWLLPKHEKTTISVNFEETSTYDEAYMVIGRGGLLKRSYYVTGGFYYEGGKTSSRTVTKEASDGTIVETTDDLYKPTEIGLFLRFEVSKFQMDAEFAAVQAGSGGPKTDTGESTLEDYSRLRVAAFIPWNKKELNYYLSVIHKTLSYSDNVHMSLDTIPMTSAHFKIINGSFDRHFFVGLIYGYARDTQSIPEFNAKYRIDAYGGKLGFNYRF